MELSCVPFWEFVTTPSFNTPSARVLAQTISPLLTNSITSPLESPAHSQFFPRSLETKTPPALIEIIHTLSPIHASREATAGNPFCIGLQPLAAPQFAPYAYSEVPLESPIITVGTSTFSARSQEASPNSSGIAAEIQLFPKSVERISLFPVIANSSSPLRLDAMSATVPGISFAAILCKTPEAPFVQTPSLLARKIL